MTIKRWAERNDLTPAYARLLAATGKLKTAVKHGKMWFVSGDERWRKR